MPRQKGGGKAKEGKGKAKRGKGKGKGWGNEGDATYVGYDFGNDNYYSEYPTFAGDIGLLTECIPSKGNSEPRLNNAACQNMAERPQNFQTMRTIFSPAI